MAKKPPKPIDRPASTRHKGKESKGRPHASNFMTQQWKNRPEFKSVLVEIRTQNDRGAAITAGAAVEHSITFISSMALPADMRWRLRGLAKSPKPSNELRKSNPSYAPLFAHGSC
jgi:hypothetical protein